MIYLVDSVIQPYEQQNPAEVFAIPKKFVLREGLQQPRHVYVKSLFLVQLKIGNKEKKLQLT